MELDVRLMLTVGGMLISVVSAAAIARHQIKNILDTLGKDAASLKSLDRRVDTIEADNETTKHRLNIFASMFSPDNMEKKAREVERIKTEVEYLKGK